MKLTPCKKFPINKKNRLFRLIQTFPAYYGKFDLDEAKLEQRKLGFVVRTVKNIHGDVGMYIWKDDQVKEKQDACP